MNSSHIIIIDFESQYTKLIAKLVRKENVYCEVYHYTQLHTISKKITGIICSGSYHSVLSENSPKIDWEKYDNIPILTICYSTQLFAHYKGANIIKSQNREFGKTEGIIIRNHPLWNNIENLDTLWMSHNDSIQFEKNDINILAKTKTNKVVAFEDNNVISLLFHPEVSHTCHGKKIVHNFLKICKCSFDWTPKNICIESIKNIKNKIGTDKVIMAVSGGVDSTVAATLIHKSIGKQLQCVLVNNGLMRENEIENVKKIYEKIGLNIVIIEASFFFIKKLKNITEPEKKRKIIGHAFIDTFTNYVDGKNIQWLGQGTIYPDVIESNYGKHTIKSHHNVGGLPENLSFKLIEPLRNLFKDEVRELGKELQIPDCILARHPFPGTGLGIRIIGSITLDKIKMLQKADQIYISLLRKHNLYDKIWQAGAILLPIKSVGVMGDCRTYGATIALRAVTSIDGMTADVYPIPYDVLIEISTSIVNSVPGINRVVYDITTKPPSTIEWE